MKTQFLILVFIGFSMQAICQKIDERYINTKTGDTVLSSLWNNVTYEDNGMFSFRMVHMNSDFYLELKFNFGKNPPFWVSKNDSVWVKFSDGLTIQLYSEDSVHSERGMAAIPDFLMGVTIQGVYVKYKLTFMQVMIFQSQPVQKMRVFYSRGFENIVFEKKQGNILSKCAELVSQRVDKYDIISVNPKDSEKEKKHPDESKKDW